MDLWNIQNLVPPSEDFCRYDVNDIRKLGNVAKLVKVLTNTAKEFGSQNILWAEVKLFQAMKKRIALSQSRDKFMKFLQQVDHCIRNFNQMKMSEVFKNLAKKFMRSMERSKEHLSVIHHPSRQQLEFVLIQCQGASKLLCQTQNYISSAFSYLVLTLGVGHVLQKLLMACAVISRISTILRYLLFVICNTYRELFPWLCKLKEGKWKWDPLLSLPEDLETWLGPEELKLQSNKPPSALVPFLGKLFSSEENGVMSEQQLQPEQKSEDEINEKMDFGEVVSRPVIEETSSSFQLLDLKKTITEAESVKTLQIMWKQIFVEQKPELITVLPHPPHLKTEKKIKNLLTQLKEKVAIAKEKQQKNKARKLVKQAGIAFASHLGMQNDVNRYKEHETAVKNYRVQDEDVTIILENVKPVRTLKELRELRKFLYNSPHVKHNSSLMKQIQELFEENFENAKLLKSAGETKLCRKLLLRTSKKMISICKESNVT